MRNFTGDTVLYEFMREFEMARPGDWLLYHEGFLARDRDKKNHESKMLSKLADKVLQLCKSGQCVFVQKTTFDKNTIWESIPRRRRISADAHQYYVVKLGPADE